MRARSPRFFAGSLALAAAVAAAVPARADDAKADADGWVTLVGDGKLDAWNAPATNWETVGSVAVNPNDPKKLTGESGSGVVYNGAAGRAVNLISRESFGDVEVHLEFLVPKGSNSGVKLEAVYEVQIFDSFGVKDVKATHSGGVYPRAELLPKYHHIDEGYPPKVNASKAPGEWQTLDVVFRSPKFGADGKKTADARFEKVVLNGQVVQEGLSVPCPTGNNWRKKEEATGPILLQGDHGPVAFRNVRARPLR